MQPGYDYLCRICLLTHIFACLHPPTVTICFDNTLLCAWQEIASPAIVGENAFLLKISHDANFVPLGIKKPTELMMHFISRLYFNSYPAGAQCALHILSYPLHEIVLICFSAFVPVVLHLCILLCTYLMFINFDVTNISYGCALCFCEKKSDGRTTASSRDYFLCCTFG